MHTWHWHTWQGASYLTCSLLKDWAHGFLTQQFWSRPPEALVDMLRPTAQVYRVKQVHGDRVLNASALEPMSRLSSPREKAPESPTQNSTASADPVLSEADGLFTTDTNQAIWVCTADCTPVLIGDIATGQVAAVHAGWRGTAAAIVPKAIEQLQAQGSQIQDLRIAMGPAIAGEVYQVSTTVAAQVGATILPDTGQPDPVNPQAALADTDEILAQLRQLPNSPILDDPQPGRARLDVRRVNAMQLEQLGIEPNQVAIAPYCTYQNPELFFSYRRQPQKKVQWSGIVSGGSDDV
ncbi:peptidoglycan editing factor PgeF [Leptolyngbya sp. NK1-12]|uniref:Purine nucleoside phosphorylase n=1 Tax=Leptolyngbya sp. NK1-12 TaxID=2547451 RepID=A0AA96WB84_9CYAN|nr:peptidoglycan editing factor PgeF [Leptolyngbya sp. NK1-12]WNZ21868.1 peptidoglycan editing factor PgeF [Leptolyngbya sp. NK1-12]